MPQTLHYLLELPTSLAGHSRERPQARLGKLRRWVMEPAIILAGMAGVVWLVHATGGIKFVYAHLMYLPIIAAGFLFGLPGGLLAGLLAGLALGPLTPISTATGEPQALQNWLTRLGLFLLVGGLNGLFIDLERKNAMRLQRLLDTSRRSLSNVMRTFTAVISAKDKITSGHSERVAHNAYSLARQLGLNGHRLQEIYWAGLLHDIGKVWVPDHVLMKPGKLSKEEYSIMQKHARLGENLLRKLSPVYREISKGVGQHHERWDGKGYPEGLSGEHIHIYGRVLAVVDVFEAMTTDRPYRDRVPKEEALTMVKSGSGAHFDPLAVAAFVNSYQTGTILVDGEDRRWERLPQDLDENQILASMLGRLTPPRMPDGRRRPPGRTQGARTVAKKPSTPSR